MPKPLQHFINNLPTIRAKAVDGICGFAEKELEKIYYFKFVPPDSLCFSFINFNE